MTSLLTCKIQEPYTKHKTQRKAGVDVCMVYTVGRNGARTVAGQVEGQSKHYVPPVLTAHGRPHWARCLPLWFSSCEKILSRQKGRCLREQPDCIPWLLPSRMLTSFVDVKFLQRQTFIAIPVVYRGLQFF